ncbi:hypothetical protein QUA82_28425 [Microcoleus sp. F8-D3]
MQVHIETFTVRKRFALTISRGTTAPSTNLWVKLAHEGIEGWGEASPFSTGSRPQTTEILLAALQEVAPLLEKFTPFDRQKNRTSINRGQLTLSRPRRHRHGNARLAGQKSRLAAVENVGIRSIAHRPHLRHNRH